MEKICKHGIVSEYTVSKWEPPLIFLSILFYINSLYLQHFGVSVNRSLEKVIPCQRFSDTMYSSWLNPHQLWIIFINSLFLNSFLKKTVLSRYIACRRVAYFYLIINITFMIVFSSFKPWNLKITVVIDWARVSCHSLMLQNGCYIILIIILLIMKIPE